MRHTRDEVIARTIAEFERLDALVSGLTVGEWALPLPRPETQDPWTVQDALAHITHWKADTTRRIEGRRRPPEERGLDVHAGNRLVYRRWMDRPPAEVLAWHRQVQRELVIALRRAPETWFAGREHRPDWPYDLDGHSASHRARDIAAVIAGRRNRR